MIAHAPNDPPHFTVSRQPGPETAGRGLLGKPELGYVTILGSSSAASTSLYNPSIHNLQFYGESMVHNALNRLGHPVGYVRDMHASAQSGPGQYHFGISGSTLAAQLVAGGIADRCIARCAAAAAASGKAVALIAQAGSNDIGNGDSASTVLARVEDLILRCKAAAGVKLIMLQVWPRLYAASGPDEAVILPQRLALNSGLIQLCAAHRVPLIPCASVGEDPAAPGYLKTTWADATRPGHPATPMGDELGILLRDKLLETFRIPRRVDLATLAGSAVNANVQLAGPGGSSNPTGWVTGNLAATGSAPTHTRSTVPYGDGTGRNWLRLVCSANGGNGTVQLGLIAAGTTGFVPGDIVEGMCEIRFPTASGFSIGAIWAMVFWTPSYYNSIGGQPKVAQQAPPISVQYTDQTLILRTMPSEIPSGATGVSIQIQIHGSGTVDVGSPCILINRPSPDYS